MNRRLAAILMADIVGYSRLMHQDEEGTLNAFKTIRSDIVDGCLARHSGRVVKLMGDGLLVEFASAVSAVGAAIEIQSALAARGGPIRFRIGINLGDVIVEEDDVFGDGVNVAARLEAAAEPGSICISGSVYEQIRNKMDDVFEDLGERALKNIDRPVRLWQWRSGDKAPFADEPARASSPSIAVLPFENMSPDPEFRFFGDGLSEDIITTLSKISSLTVIARNSSFSYKERSVDLRSVGRELGARYVLDGSIRAAGGRVRVTAQLTDASAGSHIWAERYDRRMEDLFAVQDEITREIVTALRTKLSDGEEAQLWLGGAHNIEAWSAVMAAHDCIFNATADNLVEAREHLERALSHDPEYAAAHALIGQVVWMQIRFGFAADRPAALAELGAAAKRAEELDPGNALAQLMLAATAQLSGERADALRLGRRAVELSPSNAFVRMAFGRLLILMGQPAEAEEHLRLAFRLNPHGPIVLYGILANALEQQGNEEEAIALLREAVAKNPDYLTGHLRLASLLGLAGMPDPASEHVSEIRRIRPQLDRGAIEEFYGTDDPAALERFLDGLCKAGLDVSATDQPGTRS